MASSPLASRTVVANHNRASPAKSSTNSQHGLSPQRTQDDPKLIRRSSYTTLSSARSEATDGAQWGENFWITIADPQTGAQFYACPATGDASWDPPAGHFVMPPSDAGEWWELLDEARDIPYYYHTKTKETQWTRPEGFVIPLNIIQTTTALGRRFSLNARKSMVEDSPSSNVSRSGYRGQRSPNGLPIQRVSFSDTSRRTASAGSSPPSPSPSGSGGAGGSQQRSYTNSTRNTHALYTIPSEPSNSQQSLGYIPETPKPAVASSNSVPELRTQSLTGAVQKITGSSSFDGRDRQARVGSREPSGASREKKRSESPSSSIVNQTRDSPPGSKSKKGGGVFSKMLSSSTSGTGFGNSNGQQQQASLSSLGKQGKYPAGLSANGRGDNALAGPNGNALDRIPSSNRPGPAGTTASISKNGRSATLTSTKANGKPQNGSTTDLIGAPVLDRSTTEKMNPAIQNGNRPVMVDPRRLSTGTQRTLPRELVDEIEQFMTSEFAQSYFSTHRRGLIFRRRVPLEEMMTWQKAPLTSPLLVMKRQLHKDAVKIFKVIQAVMGDREIVRGHIDGTSSMPNLGASTSSMPGSNNDYQRNGGGVNGSLSLLEPERWMLSMGVSHGELRDEIYCQLMKQLTSNPDADSVFRGWQLFCVILVTFPPSKNLEAYVGSFIQERITTKRDDPGRLDIMAKYCLGRLGAIAKKGPRGKPPTFAEIETASDAAFNPSTFGASLDFIFKLQQRSYPDLKVPIILPFLGDGIIALGGLQTEGIWRISGDGETVSELKVRIDRGYYNLEGIDDCHVPASLLKLWLRELEEPLIPESMYNECLAVAHEPEKVVGMVRKLPTINRRVMLFVISLLQLFLHDDISAVTKMTSPAMALVISPALLRCNSDKFSTVFTNAQHEHTFTHNLLLHLQPHRIDPDYIPVHGQGSSPRNR